MKYFKFWVKESFTIKIDGASEHLSILAGSNTSKEDARAQARHQSEVIEKRISLRERKKEYDTPIREHVAQVIDNKNIITVCRYGAKILNSNQYTFWDLDDYPVSFLDFFSSVRKLPKKDRIVRKFMERIKRHPELGSDFRVYETSKGIRVIGKHYIAPSGKKYRRLMQRFCVDWIYIVMSIKQNCHRARVSPKPYRMRIKTFKVHTPLDCETQQYLDWAKDYEIAAERFSVVKLVTTIGEDFSSEPVIQLHDSMCNANAGYTLA